MRLVIMLASTRILKSIFIEQTISVATRERDEYYKKPKGGDDSESVKEHDSREYFPVCVCVFVCTYAANGPATVFKLAKS
jgi:hypothetical protein